MTMNQIYKIFALCLFFCYANLLLLSLGNVLIKKCVDGGNFTVVAGTLLRIGCEDLDSLLIEHDFNISLFSSNVFMGAQLTRIELFYNHQLKTIPNLTFSRNPRLVHLDLGHNKISSVQDNFSTMPALTTFRLSENDLYDFDTSILPSTLQEVSVSKNHLSKIDFIDLPMLTNIYLSYNSLSFLHLENLPNLIKLDLNSNIELQYENIHFDVHTDLADLIINRVDLSRIYAGMLDGFPKLSNLDIDRGYVTAIDKHAFLYNPLIELMDMSSESRTSLDCCQIPGVYESLSQIRFVGTCTSVFDDSNSITLNLETPNVKYFQDGNCICPDYLVYNSTTDSCEDSCAGNGTFSVQNETLTRDGCVDIVILNYANFEIKYFQPLVFHNLLSLKSINLRNNHLAYVPSDVFSVAPSLSQLYLDSNQITIIDDDFSKIALVDLNLYGNHLTSIPSLSKPKLEQFYFGGNNVSTVLLTDFPMLHTLNLRDCGLKNFSIVNVPNLKVLELNGNLDFDFYHTLNLSNNELLRASLTYLDLRQTQMKRIVPGMFNSFPLLTALFLDSNPITAVAAQSFANNLEISQLNFENTLLDCCQIPGINEFLGIISFTGRCINSAINKTIDIYRTDLFIEADCQCEIGQYYLQLNHKCTNCLIPPNCMSYKNECSSLEPMYICEKCHKGYTLEQELGRCVPNSKTIIVVLVLVIFVLIFIVIGIVWWLRKQGLQRPNDEKDLLDGLSPRDFVMKGSSHIELQTDEEYESRNQIVQEIKDDQNPENYKKPQNDIKYTYDNYVNNLSSIKEPYVDVTIDPSFIQEYDSTIDHQDSYEDLDFQNHIPLELDYDICDIPKSKSFNERKF